MSQKCQKEDKSFPGCTPGNEWRYEHLEYFNIHVKNVGERTIFGVPPEDLPNPQFQDPKYNILMGGQNLLESLWPSDIPLPNPNDDKDNDVWQLLYLIYQCQSLNVNESYTDELASCLFKVLKYSIMQKRVVRTRSTVPLEMSGGRTYATPDLSILTVSGSLYILACQEDKRNANGNTDATPQLMAEIIASSQSNYKVLDRVNKDKRGFMLIPGILMHGTYPMFYLVPISQALANHVRAGTRPPFETIVLRYAPRCVRSPFGSGMLIADNRRVILKAYEAFRHFVPMDMDDPKISIIPPHLERWFQGECDHDPEAFLPETMGH